MLAVPGPSVALPMTVNQSVRIQHHAWAVLGTLYPTSALSQSLQSSSVDTSVQSLSDVCLQVFAFMTKEFGRLLSRLTLTCRQVWLAHSPLSEPCRRALCTLPVVPGQVFGPAAQQALKLGIQSNQTRQLFASLRGSTPLAIQRPP